MVLSVLTMTYNRAYILNKAYESLKRQTSLNFEWVIIDDGSTDGTEELIAKWQNEDSGVNIRYFNAGRVGLSRGLMFGYEKCQGEYIIRLDSDDWFESEAIAIILNRIEAIRENAKIAAVGFPRNYPDGSYMKKQKPLIPCNGYVECNNIERKKFNLDMDCVEAYKRKLLLKYEYPVWEGEMFTPEEVHLNSIALDEYVVRWYDDRIYICDYLQDGLTVNSDVLIARNPMGFAILGNTSLLYDKKIKRRFRKCANIIALSLYGRSVKYIGQSNAKFLTVLAFPLGIVLFIRRKRQFKALLENNK